jgi:hypothetical protein
LHFGKTEIFLSEGLDRFLLICPSGYFVAPMPRIVIASQRVARMRAR